MADTKYITVLTPQNETSAITVNSDDSGRIISVITPQNETASIVVTEEFIAFADQSGLIALSSYVYGKTPNWDTAYDYSTAYSLASSTFATVDFGNDFLPLSGGELFGDLNVQTRLLSANVDLFDIFLTSETDQQTLSYSESSYELSISNGNIANLSSINTTFNQNSGKYENGYSWVSLNSADANFQTVSSIFYGDGSNLTGIILTGQDSINTIVFSNSADWNKAFELSTVYSNNSARYEDLITLVGNNSATTWNYQGTDLKSLSANWQSTYTTVSNISANWQSVYTTVLNNSAYTQSLFTSVAPNSANWQSTYTTVRTNSANAASVYTSMAQNSATYATINFVDNNYFPLAGDTVTGFTTFLSSVIVNGNFTIGGNLTALGNTTFASTTFTTTSSLSIVNVGAGPALYINQVLAPYDIASFYGGNTPVFHVGTPQIIDGLGRVGINTIYPNYELTVRGSISATENFITNGSIDAWTANLGNTDSLPTEGEFIPLSVIGSSYNSVFNSIQNLTPGVSASTDMALYSDDGIAYIDIGINSSTWDGNVYSPTFNNIGPNDGYLYSQNSNLVIGTCTAGFGDLIFYTGGVLSGTEAFGGNDRLRILNTGNIGINENSPTERLTVKGSISASDILYALDGNSLIWNSVYSEVQSNSAINWNYQGTDLKDLSANWDSTYNTVQSNSALNWNYQGTDLKSLSGNWQSTYTNVHNNSASWGSLIESYETVSQNLKDYPKAFNYSGSALTSISYTTLTGTIVKTLNYTNMGVLTSIRISGDLPVGIYVLKTLSYNLSGVLMNIGYNYL